MMFVTPAGTSMERAMTTPPCPVCGHIMPWLLSHRVIVHTGRSGFYACAGHTDAEYAKACGDRLAKYDQPAT